MRRKLSITLLIAFASLAVAGVAVASTEVGDSGPNKLVGTDGPDQLYGEDGADTLLALAGDDYLEGGPGADTMRGGSGVDLLIAGTGVDRVEGEGGRDSVYAGHGNDYVAGGGSNDTILGQAGDDRLVAGANDDRVWGGAGADRALGGDGDDHLSASTQSIVGGGRGSDRIYLHDEGGPVPRLSDPTSYEVRAGDHADVVDARDGQRNDVDCGAGTDRLLADRGDRAVRCEARSEHPR